MNHLQTNRTQLKTANSAVMQPVRSGRAYRGQMGWFLRLLRSSALARQSPDDTDQLAGESHANGDTSTLTQQASLLRPGSGALNSCLTAKRQLHMLAPAAARVGYFALEIGTVPGAC